MTFFDAWGESSRVLQERFDSALREGDRKAAEITVTLESPDEGVRVVVGPDKRISGLTIDPEAYDDYDEDSLADTIIATYQVARRRVTQLQRECLDEEIGLETHGHE